ncbi:MAG: hypothetical protein ACJZ4J_01540 [Candidatus Poseidoniales archaeon]
MVEAPADTRLLSDTEVADSWIDAKRIWMQGGFYCSLIIISFSTIATMGILEWNQSILVISVTALLVLSQNFRKIGGARNQLDVIAISTGHPWHDSESTGTTTVFVLGDEKWVGLHPGVRIVPTRDPMLDRTLLRDGSPEGEVLVRWEGEADSRIVAIINMAQALANAQDRGEDDVDSFEEAREREETSEGLLEREWMDTDEGSIDYEPGAILRAFKRSKDSDDDSELKDG